MNCLQIADLQEHRVSNGITLIIRIRNSIKKKGFEYFVHVLIAFLFTF